MYNKLFYKGLILVGWVALIANNFISGWGTHHGLAAFVDGTAGIMVGWGLIGDITRNLTVTKTENNNIYPKNFTLNDYRGKDDKTNFVVTKER